jgi:syntaxin-binding protein 1
MELGVIALEKLELGRKPFPKMHAIYFITPSETSIGHLLSDYADKKNPQYGAVHLIFTNEVPQQTMTKIA